MVTNYRMDENYYVYKGKRMPVPGQPVEERLSLAKLCCSMERQSLEAYNKGWMQKGVSYEAMRRRLVRAVSAKAVLCLVKREYERMSPEEIEAEKEVWKQYEKRREKELAEQEALDNKPDEELTEEEWRQIKEENWLPAGYMFVYDRYRMKQRVPILTQKLLKLRKVLGLTQRDFAKQIGYNINKYGKLEQGKLEELGLQDLYEAFPMEFTRKVVEETGVNPYWLLKNREDSLDEVEKDQKAMSWEEAVPGVFEDWKMFASQEVIEAWKRERYRFY